MARFVSRQASAKRGSNLGFLAQKGFLTVFWRVFTRLHVLKCAIKFLRVFVDNYPVSGQPGSHAPIEL